MESLTSIQAIEASIRARALDLDFYATFFMGHHAKLRYSTMHRDFFEDDRVYIDALIGAYLSVEDFRDNSDYPELLNRALNKVRGWKKAWAAPRGNAKSTIKTRLETLRDVCYELEPFIVIFSNTSGQAEGRVWEVQREIDNNKKIEKYYGKISGTYVPKTKRVWTRSHFITTTGVRVMSSSMMAESRGLADGENRPTKVIFDDLENSEHVVSPVQRAKADEWFTKVPSKLGGPNTPTNFSFAGTVLHRQSLLAGLLKNPGWTGRRYQAIVKWPDNQGLWDECKAIFIDLNNPNRKEEAEAFYEANREEMDAGSEVLWPDGEPLYLLYTMLWTDGPSSFSSEKQNEPDDPSKQLFKWSERNFFDLEQDDLGRWVIQRNDGRKVLLSECTTVAFLDPAFPKDKSVDPDFAAIVVLAADDYGYGYVLDIYMRQEQASSYLRQVPELNRLWKPDEFGYENNGAQDLLADNLARILDEIYDKEKQRGYRGYPYWDVPFRGFTHSSKKTERVSKLEAPILNGWLMFRNGLSNEFWEQMRTFPHGSHDDGPDALEAAWTRATRGVYVPEGFNRD